MTVFSDSLVRCVAEGSDTAQGLSPDCKDVSVSSSCARTVSCAPWGGGWIIADLFFFFLLSFAAAAAAAVLVGQECAFSFAVHSFFSPSPPSGPSIADPHGKEGGGEGVQRRTLLWCSGNVTDLLASVSQRGITNPGLPNGIWWDRSGVPQCHVCPELMPPALPWKILVKENTKFTSNLMCPHIMLLMAAYGAWWRFFTI